MTQCYFDDDDDDDDHDDHKPTLSISTRHVSEVFVQTVDNRYVVCVLCVCVCVLCTSTSFLLFVHTIARIFDTGFCTVRESRRASVAETWPLATLQSVYMQRPTGPRRSRGSRSPYSPTLADHGLILWLEWICVHVPALLCSSAAWRSVARCCSAKFGRKGTQYS